MKKILVFILASFVFAIALNAQQSKGVAALFRVGHTSLTGSHAALDKLIPAGNGGFNKNFLVFGIESYYRTTKAMLVFEGNIAAPNSKLSGDEKTELLFGTAYVKFGWIISEHKNNWIYPSIGAGLSQTAINTVNTTYDADSHAKNKLLLNSSFDFGLNADFIITKIPERKYYRSMLLGIRTGHQVSIKNNGWRVNDGKKLSYTPYYGHNGFYITATIGSGFFMRRK